MFNRQLLKTVARQTAEQMLGKLIPVQSKRSEITQIVTEWVLFSLKLGVQLYMSRIQTPAFLRPPLNQEELSEEVSGHESDFPALNERQSCDLSR